MTKKVIGIAVAAVMFAVLVPGLNAQTVVLGEDFEGSFPPSGWTTTVGGDYSNQWYRNDYTSCANYTGGGGFCACNDDDYWYYGTQIDDNCLVSSYFDASEFDTYELRFRYTWADYNCEDAFVDYYDGEGWIQLDQMSYTGTSGNMLYVRDVTAEIGGMANARIRWRYDEDCSSGWAYWYEVDAVEVLGEDTTGGPGPGDDLDLEMAQILCPQKEEAAGVAIEPECKVYSNLDGVTGARVECKIRDRETWQIIYTDDHDNHPFDEGYTDVTFKPFTPEGGKRYDAEFIVLHDDDVDDSNNSLDLENWGPAGGVDAVMINSPADDQYNSFGPSCDFTEIAGVATLGVDLIYIVEDMAYAAVVASDTMTHDFDADETYTADYSSITLDNGTYTITFWAEYNKGPYGAEQVKTFTYTGVVEIPEVEAAALSVSGSTVSYTLGSSTMATVRVYDAAGNVVATLAEGLHPAGTYSAELNVSPGIYFVKLSTPDYSESVKAVVVF